MVSVIVGPEEFTSKVTGAEAGKLVVVDFFADWCGPCKMISPKLDGMAKEFANVLFFKLDVDQNESIAEDQNINAMPTFCFFKNGKKLCDVMGANEDSIRKAIKDHM